MGLFIPKVRELPEEGTAYILRISPDGYTEYWDGNDFKDTGIKTVTLYCDDLEFPGGENDL